MLNFLSSSLFIFYFVFPRRKFGLYLATKMTCTSPSHPHKNIEQNIARGRSNFKPYDAFLK